MNERKWGEMEMENKLTVNYTWGTNANVGLLQSHYDEVKTILGEAGERIGKLIKTSPADASFRDFSGKTVDVPIRTTV